MSALKSLGFLTRVCEPPELAYDGVFLCTFFLGTVSSIISITYSSGRPKFIHLTDCAEHKLAWGSMLAAVPTGPSGLGGCGLGVTGLGGGWWKVCFSDLGDLRSRSGSATEGFDLGSVTSFL